MSAFGNPNALVRDGNTMGATDLSRNAKASIWGSLPMAMDEMGGTQPGVVAQMISMIGNGSSRERANVKGGLESGATWSLVNTVMANVSQRDLVAVAQKESTAIQYRLLEVNVEDVVRFDATSLTTFNADLGHIANNCAGALIHLMICKMTPNEANELVTANVNKAQRLLGAPQDARFQYRLLGAILTLQDLLKGAVFDTDELVDTFKAAFDEGAQYVSEVVLPSDEIELLSLALQEMRPFTLRTETETYLGHNKGAAYDRVLNERPPTTIHGRFVRSGAYAYMSTKFLREWAQKHSISEREILKVCREKGLVEKGIITIDLCKGTGDSGMATTRVHKVNVRRLSQELGYDPYTAEESANVIPLPGANPVRADAPVKGSALSNP
jgi:hypothetical protein